MNISTANQSQETKACKPSLIGFSRKDLSDIAVDMGQEPFKGLQLFKWIYNKGSRDFESMTDLPQDFRNKLITAYSLKRPTIKNEYISEDGTCKWLASFEDGQQAETVMIPEGNRITLCISSQVGCTLTCKFCYTGTQRLVRNLSAGEIVGQVLVAKEQINNCVYKNPKEKKMISNIVFMGMGEPLYNFDNIKKSVEIIKDKNGIAFSHKKITLSTSGIIPQIKKCGEEIGLNLAISLHSPEDAIRTQIMPINKKYPIKELIKACKIYTQVSNTKLVTFEYVMLKNLNDSDEDAKKLVKLVKGVECKFNLIPFNGWPNSTFQCSSNKRILRFQKILQDSGLNCFIRTPRGLDILAACGQLKTPSVISKHRKNS